MSPRRPLLVPSLVSLMVLAALASQARAQSAPSATRPPGAVLPSQPAVAAVQVVEHESRWYGWQILAADAAMLAAMPVSGGGTFFAMPLTGPIIHLSHGHPGRAAGSLALRVGAPYGGFMLGLAACTDDGDSLDCLGPAVGGFLLGAVVAETIDVAIATDTVTRTRTITPSLGYDGERSYVGLGGSF